MRARRADHSLALACMAALGLLAACTPNPARPPVTGDQTLSGSRPGQSGTLPTATPGATPSGLAASPATKSTGRVLGADGKPVANALVRGFVPSETGPSGYTIKQAGLETRTDAEGRFTLVDPERRALNLEASDGEARKAIAFGVAADASGLELRLVPPGTFNGRVTAPKQPDVTDLGGIDVFVVGLPYLVQTGADGQFSLAGLPVAANYELVATRTGLGQARATGLALKAGDKLLVPDLELSPIVPVVASLYPPAAGPGATITLKGQNFGFDVSAGFAITVGGLPVAAPERPNASTLTFQVPAGATSGDVVVTVAGLKSPPAPFKVVQTLALATTPSELLVGDTGAYAAVAKDTKGGLLQGITLEWAVEGDALKVDGSGLVTAVKAGKATLIGRSGELAARLELLVSPRQAVVDTLAGTGASGQADGPGGALGTATFTGPLGLALDGASLLVADGTRLRKLATKLPTFDVAALGADAAAFKGPAAIAVRDGFAWVADAAGFSIKKVALRDQTAPVTTVAGTGVAGAGDGEALSARLGGVTGLAFGPDGTLYMADPDHHRIRTLSPGGVVGTLVGQGAEGGFANGAAAVARLSGPRDVWYDAKAVPNCLYVADTGNQRVRRVVLEDAGPRVETVAGGAAAGQVDGTAIDATFTRPISLALDGQGHLLVADDAPGSALVRLVDLEDAEFAVSTLAGGPSLAGEVIDGAGRDVRFAGLGDLTVDAAGVFYLADPAGKRIRRLTLRQTP